MPSYATLIECAFLARQTARYSRRCGQGKPWQHRYEQDARNAFKRAYTYLKEARERREWDNARAN